MGTKVCSRISQYTLTSRIRISIRTPHFHPSIRGASTPYLCACDCQNRVEEDIFSIGGGDGRGKPFRTIHTPSQRRCRRDTASASRLDIYGQVIVYIPPGSESPSPMFSEPRAKNNLSPSIGTRSRRRATTTQTSLPRSSTVS